MPNAKLELAADNGPGEINIFIHGFGRLKGKDLNWYLHLLRELRLKGRTYLVNWDSGLFWRPLIPVALAAGGILGYALYTKFKGTETSQRGEARGLFKNVLSLGIPALPLLPVAAGIEFNFSKRKADALGLEFQKLLGTIPRIKEEPVNLIGFSLGARMLHTALHELNWKDYQLKDVCFLGGATDASSHNWNECVEKINGYIYNFYSKNDDALAVKPDTERNIGRHPIPLESPRVVNIETVLHHHRYPSYNDQLKELLQVLGPIPDPALSA